MLKIILTILKSTTIMEDIVFDVLLSKTDGGMVSIEDDPDFKRWMKSKVRWVPTGIDNIPL